MNVKIKSASKSAFFNPRVLIGLAFCWIGVLLASAVAFSAFSVAPPAELASSSNTNAVSITPVGENSITPVEESSNIDVLGGCAWTAATVLTPPAVFAPAVTSVGSNLYAFGGSISGGTVNALARSFDGIAWTTLLPLPLAVTGAAAVNDGTNIYILGGRTGTVVQNTLTRYNVAANTYTVLAPFTTATWNHAAVYLNGKIYKITGSTTTAFTPATNVLEIYDVANNTWSLGAPYLQALTSVGSFVQGDFIYGAGGLDNAGAVSAKTFRYDPDPAANSWNDAAIADLPATRMAAASGFYAGEGVLAGGLVGGTAVGNISNTAISWDPDPAINTWSNVPNMLQARWHVNGAVLGGSFYVVGGNSGVSTANNDNQKLTCTLPPPTPTATATATATAAATPTATATVPPTPCPTATPIANCGLGNISTRGVVQTGDNILIGGFIVEGTVPKRVLIRAIGPSLTGFGVPNALADPVLELRGPGGTSTTNDNWKDTQEDAIRLTGIAPTNDLESAILATLGPGLYTALVSGRNNTTGVALVEVYNLD